MPQDASHLFGKEHVRSYRETGGELGHDWKEGSSTLLLTTIGQPGASKFDDRILTVVDTMGRSARGETIPPGRLAAYR